MDGDQATKTFTSRQIAIAMLKFKGASIRKKLAATAGGRTTSRRGWIINKIRSEDHNLKHWMKVANMDSWALERMIYHGK